jgi:hypothetical protein
LFPEHFSNIPIHIKYFRVCTLGREHTSLRGDASQVMKAGDIDFVPISARKEFPPLPPPPPPVMKAPPPQFTPPGTCPV